MEKLGDYNNFFLIGADPAPHIVAVGLIEKIVRNNGLSSDDPLVVGITSPGKGWLVERNVAVDFTRNTLAKALPEEIKHAVVCGEASFPEVVQAGGKILFQGLRKPPDGFPQTNEKGFVLADPHNTTQFLGLIIDLYEKNPDLEEPQVRYEFPKALALNPYFNGTSSVENVKARETLFSEKPNYEMLRAMFPAYAADCLIDARQEVDLSGKDVLRWKNDRMPASGRPEAVSNFSRALKKAMKLPA